MSGIKADISSGLLDRFLKREEMLLGPHATPSSSSVRKRPDKSAASDFRTAFAIDADRILHSQSFTRYIDKTQVFSLLENDNITRRVIHIQLLSKIARTIGRVLRLNEDLIEAIALGHDIGHCPFGHTGEMMLSRACLRNGIGEFHHNLQSLQALDRIEKGGKGLNLSLQVLDGIVCHDGETHMEGIRPEGDRGLDRLYELVEARKFGDERAMNPSTMEGCVVKLCDTISYIGRDFEDAIRLKLIRRSDLPDSISDVLGNTNGRIVFKLVESLIVNSLDKDRLQYGEQVASALGELKKFNYEHIYRNPRVVTGEENIRRSFDLLFSQLLDDLDSGRENSPISSFLGDMYSAYLDSTSNAEKVRDYIAGMTDDYFLYIFNRLFVPEKLPRKFQ